MKKNVGTIDRTVRIIAGGALLAFAVISGSAWGYLGIVPLVTGLIGWCPPYSLLGMSTCKKCAAPSADAGYACRH